MNITLDDIRSKAPEGAIHYCNERSLIAYFDKKGYVWNGFNFVIDTCWFRNKKPIN